MAITQISFEGHDATVVVTHREADSPLWLLVADHMHGRAVEVSLSREVVEEIRDDLTAALEQWDDE